MRSREREHELRHLRRRTGVRHHIDEVVDPNRKVKVKRQQPVATPGRLRELGRQQRRGVRHEDRSRRARRIELGEHTALELGVLGHRLAQQIGVLGRGREIRRQRDPRLRGAAQLGRDRPARFEPLRVGVDALACRLERRRVDVIEHDVVAVACALKPDLLAHRPGADDRDATHVLDRHHLGRRHVHRHPSVP